jgi:hypothetical protein
MVLGVFVARAFKLPAWATPALAFNNTTSRPLLLIQSLDATGILNSILTGDSNSTAIDKAKSHFLVNSMVSNSLTFALSPRLLRPHDEDADASSDANVKAGQEHPGSRDHPFIQREEDVENARISSPFDHASNGAYEPEANDRRTREEALQDFVDEETSLIPRAVIKKSNAVEREGYVQGRHY